MSIGPDLFYESWEDALRDDVRALGGSKVVAASLWPEKTDPIAARNKLNDAMNTERRERLTQEQELFIMRRAKEVRGFSAAMFFLCDEVGTERPKSKDPQDETAALQREFIESVRRNERILHRMEALAQVGPRAVKTTSA